MDRSKPDHRRVKRFNLRYFGDWNPSNRDENIVAIAIRSAHDANLRLPYQKSARTRSTSR